jgi:hypothetical protein
VGAVDEEKEIFKFMRRTCRRGQTPETVPNTSTRRPTAVSTPITSMLLDPQTYRMKLDARLFGGLSIAGPPGQRLSRSSSISRPASVEAGAGQAIKHHRASTAGRGEAPDPPTLSRRRRPVRSEIWCPAGRQRH